MKQYLERSSMSSMPSSLWPRIGQNIMRLGVVQRWKTAESVNRNRRLLGRKMLLFSSITWKVNIRFGQWGEERVWLSEQPTANLNWDRKERWNRTRNPARLEKSFVEFYSVIIKNIKKRISKQGTLTGNDHWYCNLNVRNDKFNDSISKVFRYANKNPFFNCK